MRIAGGAPVKGLPGGGYPARAPRKLKKTSALRRGPIRTKANSDRHQAAFTLIELLVVVGHPLHRPLPTGAAVAGSPDGPGGGCAAALRGLRRTPPTNDRRKRLTGPTPY